MARWVWYTVWLCQRHWGITGRKPKSWIEWLCKPRLEGVQRNHGVRRDTVEGESASLPIQKHPHCHRCGGCHWNISWHIFVPGSVAFVVAGQAPWLPIGPKHTVCRPSHSLVSHSNKRRISPFDFPVTTARQAFITHHLGIGNTESLSVVGIWILSPSICCHLIVLWQGKVPLCCIWV